MVIVFCKNFKEASFMYLGRLLCQIKNKILKRNCIIVETYSGFNFYFGGLAFDFSSIAPYSHFSYRTQITLAGSKSENCARKVSKGILFPEFSKKNSLCGSCFFLYWEINNFCHRLTEFSVIC